ncbi:orotidine-5'-phosphate decarboxylase [Acetobacterium woodii]|uniref:Orotidine 5'-phosphate decarboxylase n=1 Tax=Acetobacterium woodii (strain ATCC 29683 / DSM 1030 / JCM 2381 / KCTC 1655 / WB1) TaxID=931626 RepID=H6LH62_ACEWD|nr:orotidine-5'-phosphate decarboxylase [Acetobacterium woodii]AFA48400.1 orotidine 5'-phosphate decarboxylase PyrF [Acetobacterium woodii DSM 1030]
MMLMDRLYNEAVKKGPICVGLDTTMKFLPKYLLDKDWSDGEKITEFNKKIIDVTADLAAAYKVQIACYESLGLDGLKAYRDTVKYARSKNIVVIGDVKRGDIASTGDQYAKGHFTGDFEVDIMTVNAYMGEDAVSPYYKYIKENDKGIFILQRTSNPSAVDLQNLIVGDETVYEVMGDKIKKWGSAFIGENGFSAIGSVVGLTRPDEFEAIRERCPQTFFLVPGYGAQGGTGEDIAKILKKSRCAIVNSSRGLITGHQKAGCEDEGFANYVRKATLAMQEDILKWL